MSNHDDQLDAMANSQRRQLLVQLLVDGPQSIPYLSSVSRELLQAHPAVLEEYLSGPEEVDSANKADIRTHHVHLPKLAKYEYIEWHQDAHLATKGADFDDVKPLLESLDGTQDEHPARDASLVNQK